MSDHATHQHLPTAPHGTPDGAPKNDHEAEASPDPASAASATRVAVSATLHCLTGCAIGEVAGLVLGTWWGWSNGATIGLAVALAFFFGYALSVAPLLRGGLSLRQAVRIALAADTLSIVTMEIVDNAVILAVPGAMEASLTDPMFWGTLAFALTVAFVVTVPVNRALIVRGKGHALAHQHH